LNDLNGRECILQAIAVAVDDALVACGMKVGEAAAEFDFIAINRNAAVGGFALLRLRFRLSGAFSWH